MEWKNCTIRHKPPLDAKTFTNKWKGEILAGSLTLRANALTNQGDNTETYTDRNKDRYIDFMTTAELQ